MVERVLNGYLTETVSQAEMRLYVHYRQTSVLLKFLQKNALVQVPKSLSNTLWCHLPVRLKLLQPVLVIYLQCWLNSLFIDDVKVIPTGRRSVK